MRRSNAEDLDEGLCIDAAMVGVHTTKLGKPTEVG
jgi:hypothetical protein